MQVMTVFFDNHKTGSHGYGCRICLPDLDGVELLGFPLWRPKGKTVYLWSADMIVAGMDERWIVFGTFHDAKKAEDAFRRLKEESPLHVVGYRIEEDYCAEHRLKCEHEGELPHAWWTDG